MNEVTVLHGIALVGYLAAGAVVVSSLAAGRTAVPRLGLVLLTLAVIAHGAGLTSYTIRYHELPLVGIAASFSTIAFLIGVTLAGAAVLREGRPVSLVLIPLIAVLLAFALSLGVRPGSTPTQFRGLWFAAHVVLAFFAYASFALAFAAGLLYLLQFRALKGKNFGRAFRLFPPLETLDRLRNVSVITGFGALTFALLLGWAWTVRFLDSLATENPQVIWGVVTWFVLLTAVFARRGGAGAERRAAVASVAGFAVVVIAYVVLRLSMADGKVFL